jgi:O-antigen ligase
MIGIVVVFLGILVKSKHRLALGTVVILASLISFPLLSPEMQDRYLSIVGRGEKNAATSQERFEGMEQQIRVALRRPIFGYGLGTSPEANFHYVQGGPYVGMAMPAHNLFVELAQELGLPGLVIFLVLIKSILVGFVRSQKSVSGREENRFLAKLIDGMQVWLAMNIVFSFASYGLSSYEWYLFGGLSVVLQQLASKDLVKRIVDQEGNGVRSVYEQ